jgi:hypothetical protein
MISEAEYRRRTVAAIERLKPYPTAGFAYLLTSLARAALRFAFWTCLGFGTAVAVGISLWWALPIAIGAYFTLGSAWWALIRERRVLALERYAEDVEESEKARGNGG